MTRAQIITNENGEPEYAIIPWAEYTRLAEAARDESELTDEELYDLTTAEPGEHFPVAVTKRLVAGDNPIKVYREHRGMTQADLARNTNISAMYLSQIETGNRGGSTKVISAIAKALSVDIDDLI
jgi:DNA-binding XRE family transcriptional regulator